jgi:hypothetical protein
MYRDAAPNSEPSDERVWSGTLKAGDVMHIPRGYWHQATGTTQGTGYSLHATFGIEQRTGVDWLADRSRQDEVFRHDLIRDSAQGQHTQAQTLAAAACRLIASTSPEEFLAAREQQQLASRQVCTRGMFGAPAAVVCVTDFPPRLSSCGDTIIVLGARPSPHIADWRPSQATSWVSSRSPPRWASSQVIEDLSTVWIRYDCTGRYTNPYRIWEFSRT